MLSPLTSRRFLYASVGLTAFAVYKHTSIGINDIFPVLNKSLGAGDSITFSAKSNYLQASASLVTIGESSSTAVQNPPEATPSTDLE
jgi:hypothetical protein